jgi:hypothetical protein
LLHALALAMAKSGSYDVQHLQLRLLDWCGLPSQPMVASSGQSYSYSVGRGSQSWDWMYCARVAAGHDLETMAGSSVFAVLTRLMRRRRDRERERGHSADRQHSQQRACAERCGAVSCCPLGSVSTSVVPQSVTHSLNRCWSSTGNTIGDLDVPGAVDRGEASVGVAETQVRPWWCIQLARPRYRYLVPEPLCLCLCLCLAMALNEPPTALIHLAAVLVSCSEAGACLVAHRPCRPPPWSRQCLVHQRT